MAAKAMIALATAAMLTAAAPARADVRECQIRILQPVADDIGNHWSAGKTLPVTIERDGLGGGSYCASGGGCVPARAAQLLNCRVGAAIDAGDRRLVPDPTKGGSAWAHAFGERSEAEARLSALGFSNAAAGGLAETYVTKPRSAQARLVARALVGSPSALAALRRSQP